MVKFSIRNVPSIKLTLVKDMGIGCSNSKKAEIMKPTATALIPVSDFFIRVIFFKSSQNGTIKSMSINPGKFMPITAIKLPIICPIIP